MLASSTEELVALPAQALPERSYASVADRLVALALDAIALTVIAFLAAVVVGVVVGPAVVFHDGAGSVSEAVDVDRGVAALDALLAGILGAAYCIGSWRRGGTPGQRLLGLSVARHADGSSPPVAAAAVRWLALVAPFSLAAVIDAGLSGVGTMLWVLVAIWYLLLLASTARGRGLRGWHDRMAATVVTREVRPVAWSGTREAEIAPRDR